MQDKVWTIFHRSGRYNADYEPLWERYLCYGGTVERAVEADSAGSRKDCLTLCLPTYAIRLIDGDGQSVTFREAGIGPGDLLIAGEVSSPGRGCYRICKVTESVGAGLANGYVVSAE